MIVELQPMLVSSVLLFRRFKEAEYEESRNTRKNKEIKKRYQESRNLKELKDLKIIEEKRKNTIDDRAKGNKNYFKKIAIIMVLFRWTKFMKVWGANYRKR